MRFLRNSVLFAGLAFLILGSGALSANAAAPSGQSISGHLVFENFGACDSRCVVTLMQGFQPVQTTFADINGRFTFANVPSGRYTIRVEIGGSEVANQQIDALDSNHDMTIMVPVLSNRKASSARSGDSAVVNVSEFLDVYPKKAVSLYEKGNDSLKHKKNEEAIRFFQGAIEIAPTFYAAHNQLGIAYREQGQLDKAEIEFVKAHELNSTNVQPLLNLGSLYLDQNESERAVKTGQEAVKADSHSAPAYLIFGVALYKTSQYDRAESALKRALDLSPKLGAAHLALANVYVKTSRYDDALEHLNAYIEENPHGDQIQAARETRDRLLQARQAVRP